MGLFDSVYFTCPSCEARIEAQSKAGECYLNSYKPEAAPIEIALDIVMDPEPITCRQCKSEFHIKADPPFPTSVRLYLEPREAADD